MKDRYFVTIKCSRYVVRNYRQYEKRYGKRNAFRLIIPHLAMLVNLILKGF